MARDRARGHRPKSSCAAPNEKGRSPTAKEREAGKRERRRWRARQAKRTKRPGGGREQKAREKKRPQRPRRTHSTKPHHPPLAPLQREAKQRQRGEGGRSTSEIERTRAARPTTEVSPDRRRMRPRPKASRTHRWKATTRRPITSHLHMGR